MAYNLDQSLTADEDSHDDFTDGPYMNNLMSASLDYSYPYLNEGSGQMVGRSPQLPYSSNNPSDDAFPHVPPGLINNSSFGTIAPPAASDPPYGAPSTMNYVPPAQPLMRPESTAPQPSTTNAIGTTAAHPLSSELQLCRSCCAAVQSRLSYGTTIYLVQDTCTICRGARSSSVSDDGPESSRVQNATHNTSAANSPATPRSPRSTRNRVVRQRQQRRRQSTIPAVGRSRAENEEPFFCSFEGCNRALGGRSFARRDNRNVHERTVHGVGMAG